METKSSLSSRPADQISTGSKRSPLGCAIWVLGGILLMFLVVVGGAYYWLSSLFGQFVDMYGEDYPTNVPVVFLDQESVANLDTRLGTITAQLRPGSSLASSPILELSGDELSHMLKQALVFWTEFKAQLTIEGEEIKIVSSVPLEFAPVGLMRYPGKYINSELRIRLGYVGGAPVCSVVGVRTMQGEVPKEAFSSLVDYRFLDAIAAESPEAMSYLKRVSDLQVKDGKVVISFR